AGCSESTEQTSVTDIQLSTRQDVAITGTNFTGESIAEWTIPDPDGNYPRTALTVVPTSLPKRAIYEDITGYTDYPLVGQVVEPGAQSSQPIDLTMEMSLGAIGATGVALVENPDGLFATETGWGKLDEGQVPPGSIKLNGSGGLISSGSQRAAILHDTEL